MLLCSRRRLVFELGLVHLKEYGRPFWASTAAYSASSRVSDVVPNLSCHINGWNGTTGPHRSIVRGLVRHETHPDIRDDPASHPDDKRLPPPPSFFINFTHSCLCSVNPSSQCTPHSQPPQPPLHLLPLPPTSATTTMLHHHHRHHPQSLTRAPVVR